MRVDRETAPAHIRYIGLCQKRSRIKIERELLRDVLHTAAALGPGEVRRASSIPGYDTSQLAWLLTEILRARLVIGAAVATASNADFILVGLTRTGGQLLPDLGDDESWSAVRATIDDEWLALDVETLAALASRRCAANAGRTLVGSNLPRAYRPARLIVGKKNSQPR
jgi:hypothetical protein